MTWTTADIPDLSGRTAVVTGANSGIGFEHGGGAGPARRGTSCWPAATPSRGADALDRLEVRGAGRRRRARRRLDLADLSLGPGLRRRLRTGTARPAGQQRRGDGAAAAARTADGFEIQFGTNHLGHFALTGLLLPKLLRPPGARVVTVTSPCAPDRPDRLRRPGGRRAATASGAAYAQSKLANLLFTFELQRRARRGRASTLLSVAAHPGYAATNLQTAGPRHGRKQGHGAGQRGGEPGASGESARDGALPTLRAATDPAVRGGEVFGPDGLLELRGAPKQVAVSRRARDRSVAERLWEASEEKTGVRYPALDPA